MKYAEILAKLREKSIEDINASDPTWIKMLNTKTEDQETTLLHLVAKQLTEYAEQHKSLESPEYQKEIVIFKKLISALGPLSLFVPIYVDHKVTPFSILKKLPEQLNQYQVAALLNKIPSETITLDELDQLINVDCWNSDIESKITKVLSHATGIRKAEDYDNCLDAPMFKINAGQEVLTVKDVLMATGRIDVVQQFYILRKHLLNDPRCNKQVSTSLPYKYMFDIIEGKDKSYLSEQRWSVRSYTQSQMTLVELEQRNIIQQKLQERLFGSHLLIDGLRPLLDKSDDQGKFICFEVQKGVWGPEPERPVPYIKAVLEAFDQDKPFEEQLTALNDLAKFAGLSKKADYYDSYLKMFQHNKKN